jgi:hypothetical protein
MPLSFLRIPARWVSSTSTSASISPAIVRTLRIRERVARSRLDPRRRGTASRIVAVRCRSHPRQPTRSRSHWSAAAPTATASRTRPAR